jgi:hypothetical protein
MAAIAGHVGNDYITNTNKSNASVITAKLLFFANITAILTLKNSLRITEKRQPHRNKKYSISHCGKYSI